MRISLCKNCHCMTKTIKGLCGKCKKAKEGGKKMSKSKNKEIYTLTVKGLLTEYVDEKTANTIMDSLELYCRRHYVTNGEPAILLNGRGGSFVEIEMKK